MRRRVTELEKQETMFDEEKLQEQHDLINTIFNTTPNPFILKNKDCVYLAVNKAFCEFLGKKAEEIIGKTDYDLFPTEEAEKYVIGDKAVMSAGQQQKEEWEVKGASGTKCLQVLKSPVFDGKGRCTGILCSVTDISNIKNAEQEIKQARDNYFSITNLTGDIIVKVDTDGRWTFLNDYACKFWGNSREQLLGKEFTDYLHPDDIEKTNATVQELIKTKQPVKGLINRQKTPHGWRSVEWNSSPFFNGEGKFIAIQATGRDITERKNAEEEIVKARKQAEQYLNIAGLMLATVNADENITMINKRGCEILGYKGRELIGKNWFDTLVPKRIRGKIREVFNKLMAGDIDPVEYYENPLLTKDGEERLVAFHNTVTRNPHGEVVGVLLSAEDITERKKTEEALLKSETRLKTITDSVKDAIVMMNPQGRVAFWNPAAENIFGYKSDEALGRNVHKLLATVRYLKAHRKAFPEFVRTGRGNAVDKTIELHALRKDGQEIPVELSLSSIRINEAWHAVAIIRDITDRKRIEEELHKSEQKFKSIFDNAIDGILLADMKSKGFVNCNKRICEMLGYLSDEVLNLGVKDIHPQEDLPYVNEQFEKQAKGEITLARNIPVKRKDGTVFFADVNSSAIEIAEKNFLMGIFRDMTEFKKMEKERIKLETQLRLSQKLETIGTLAGGIAHDFNNLLTPILGYSDMALMTIGETNPLRENIEAILKSGYRAKDLVQQILTFSRQVEQERKPLALHLIVKESLQLLRPLLPTTIEIRQRINTKCGKVNADASQLHQVIMNLCTNAFHAMEKAGGILTIELKQISFDEEMAKLHLNLKEKEYAQLTVTDSGMGMDAVTVERIFEPFFSTKQVGKGTGLGLSVVHGIVRSHQGGITVNSQKNKGTTFHVYLPIIPSEITADIKEKESIQGGHERILLVDDEEVIVQMLKVMLERFGYSVVERTSSVEALNAFRHQADKVDLVITDLTMPNMTGLDLAKEIKLLCPDMPVIMITGYSETVSAEVQQRYGIQQILTKPVIAVKLANLIRRVLD